MIYVVYSILGKFKDIFLLITTLSKNIKKHIITLDVTMYNRYTKEVHELLIQSYEIIYGFQTWEY